MISTITTPPNAPTTGEQDGWAYAATGSEVYAQWERHRQRQVAYRRDVDAAQRAITEQFRAQG